MEEAIKKELDELEEFNGKIKESHKKLIGVPNLSLLSGNKKNSISELVDKEGKVNIDVKIIWDQSNPQPLKDRNTGKVNLVKSVVVADPNSTKGDGSKTAFLDLPEKWIDKFKQNDIIRISDAYTKLIKNNSENKQYRITNVKDIVKLSY